MPSQPAQQALLRKILLSSCALAMMSSSGCKSGPSFPGFGWTRQPSPETLAGNGPTTTYPVPPSASNTPSAIASKAAGTGTTASSTPTTTPQPQTGSVPSSAAMANGYTGFGASGAAPQPNSLTNRQSAPGFAANPSPSSLQPSTTSNTPSPSYSNPPSFNTSPSFAGTAPSYATPPGYTTPPTYTAPPSYIPPSGYTPPQSNPVNVASAAGTPGFGAPAAYSVPGGVPASSTSQAVGGFALPSATTAPEASASTTAPPSGFTLPGIATQPPATQPTATSTLPPSITSTPSSTVPSSAPAPGGYRPGSTAGAVSYPTTPYTTPSGSVYR